MSWDSFKDFKYDPSESKTPWGSDFGSSYNTDWNKDFTKNTDEAKSSNKGMDFLKAFTKNLFGGQGSGDSSFGGKGGGTYGSNFSQFTPDIGVITQGGGQGQYIPGKPGIGEQLLSAGLSALPAFF